MEEAQRLVQAGRRQNTVSFQLVRDPQHTAHFDPVTFGYAPQRSVASQQNAAANLFRERQGKAVIQLETPVLIKISRGALHQWPRKVAYFQSPVA